MANIQLAEILDKWQEGERDTGTQKLMKKQKLLTWGRGWDNMPKDT